MVLRPNLAISLSVSGTLYWNLLLLSHFSRVRLCATPSLGFSRQEHWSGLPFPSPMHKSESESEVAQSCLTLSDPMDCSPPGSSVHGIFQARALEWGAIAFSASHSYLLICSLWLLSYVQRTPLPWKADKFHSLALSGKVCQAPRRASCPERHLS